MHLAHHMKTFVRPFLITSALLTMVAVSFTGGFLTNQWVVQNQTSFPILTEAYNLIVANGYTPIPPAPALEYGMIRGMIDAYGDPYTSFIEPAQHELESNTLQGSYGGIGAELTRDQSGFPVLIPYPNSPASQVGVQTGDRILSIDTLTIDQNTPFDLIQASLQGSIGNTISISVLRPSDNKEYEFTITLIEFSIPSVSWHLDLTDSRLGVIRVNIIAATTANEILSAVADLQKQGALVFALDLRDNYGGLLEAGIEIARLFLSSGVIIQQQYRDQPVQSYVVDRPGTLNSIPLVVIVNHNTASAAEIIAGSLQAHNRARLICEATYGKDTIQLVFQLGDGSSLHVTAGHWWIPSDEPIIGHGFQPDITPSPPLNSNIDPCMQAARNYFYPP
jgi:carboxyl-terminal processing protease